MREERPHSEPDPRGRDTDAAPDAAFDVAPELFDVTAAGGGQRRLADDTAQ